MSTYSEIKKFDNYDEEKPIRIWVGNLAKYNEGSMVGCWLSLPMETEELDGAMKAILGADEEYQLNDWEADLDLSISQHSSPYKLNEQANRIEEECPDEHDRMRLSYLISDCSLDFEDALLRHDEVIIYEDMNLEDVAYQLVEDGCFGEIPESLSSYIDYEKIARDLDHDGYDYDVDKNCVFYFSQ